MRSNKKGQRNEQWERETARERERQQERWKGKEDNLFGDPKTHQSGQKHRNFSNCSCFADYNELCEVLNRRQNCPRRSLLLSLSPASLSLSLCVSAQNFQP